MKTYSLSCRIFLSSGLVAICLVMSWLGSLKLKILLPFSMFASEMYARWIIYLSFALRCSIFLIRILEVNLQEHSLSFLPSCAYIAYWKTSDLKLTFVESADFTNSHKCWLEFDKFLKIDFSITLYGLQIERFYFGTISIDNFLFKRIKHHINKFNNFMIRKLWLVFMIKFYNFFINIIESFLSFLFKFILSLNSF
jgi:hypothetical protein